jgi:proline dehydrogenase
MNLLRNAFLKASESSWLRSHAGSYGFMRRSVQRFLPGENLQDALSAAARLAESQVFSVLTHLGENVRRREEAEDVVRGYIEALDRIGAAGLSAEISVKLTQLGLDLDADFCAENLARIVEKSSASRTVWIDMEHSPYVDVTLSIYRRISVSHREGPGFAVAAWRCDPARQGGLQRASRNCVCRKERCGRELFASGANASRCGGARRGRSRGDRYA